MAIANLLGVAGTDVPIKDIKKLMMPFTVNIMKSTLAIDLTDLLTLLLFFLAQLKTHTHSWVSMVTHSL